MKRVFGESALPGWLVAVALIALLKVIVGALALVALAASAVPIPPFRFLLLLVTSVFTGCGLFLVWSGRADTRAGTLGTFYLVTGAVFSDGALTLMAGAAGPMAVIARIVLPLQVDAATPYLLWRFASDFPRVRTFTRSDRLLLPMRAASLIVGVTLFTANLLRALLPAGVTLPLLELLWRQDQFGAYWLVQYPLMIVAFGTLLWRTRLADSDERRRAVLLVAGITAGAALPAIYVTIVVLIPALFPLTPLRILSYPAMLSIPFTTTYAVIVQRALDIKLAIRRAFQYGLARYTVLALTLAPLVIIVVEGYRNRTVSLASLVTSSQGGWLIGVSAVGLFGLVGRDSILRSIDRQFFREQHDSRLVLTQLVEQCRDAADVASLSTLLERGIDRALRVDTVHVLLRGRDGSFASARGDVRPLDSASAVVSDLAGGGIVEIDLEHSRARRQRMSEPDLDWVADANARLLLPLRDSSRQLIGLIALGEKKSELPFSADDRALLSLVAAAAEMSIGYRQLLPTQAGPVDAMPGHSQSEAAVECTQCGSVQPSGVTCSACGAVTVPSLLPLTVGGKLAIERRIGAGGMGVVYRARDTQLDRAVAVKTLPHVSAAASVRLRREARLVAAVSHPNLALIYGAETWRGRPMLVFEHLTGGTLADRIAAGPLAANECVELGIALSSALGAIHRAGLLHRDIKPSNIGFGTDGAPKLLDFGLARVLTSIADVSPRAQDVDDRSAITTDSLLQGTPLYMSPEALLGAAPEPAHDLWALCTVLYEARAGVHPWRERAGERGHITRAAIPDIRAYAPSTPAPFASALLAGLSPDRSKRPQTAHEVERLLRLAT